MIKENGQPKNPYKQHSTDGPKLSITDEYVMVKRIKSRLKTILRPKVVRKSIVSNGYQQMQTGQPHAPNLLDMQ